MDTRQLSPSDIAQVAELYVSVFNSQPWNDGWSLEAARERLSRLLNVQDSVGVVAVADSEVVGFALGYCERWVAGEHFHLKEMCVAPKYQRNGIGSSIFESLLEILRDRGVQAIYLETAPGHAAARFYERHGFTLLNLQSMSKRDVAV